MTVDVTRFEFIADEDKKRTSERTSAGDEIRSGRSFARMERVRRTGRSYHRHDINFRGFSIFRQKSRDNASGSSFLPARVQLSLALFPRGF